MVVQFVEMCDAVTQKVPEPVEMTAFMKNVRFFTHYSFDILDHLFVAEKSNVLIEKRSDQLDIRPELVELLKKYAKQQEYSQATLYLGIYILDVYMDNYILSNFPDHQKLIAIVALLLAAKSEDLDELVPSIKDVLRMIDMSDDLGIDLRFKQQFTSKEIAHAYKSFANMYCKLEFLIFEAMEFNTVRPTVVSFLNIFQNLAVLPGDDLKLERSNGDLRVTANEFIHQFMDVIINEIDFQNLRPSELAAAVIASTRKLLNNVSYWNDELAEFTRYKIEAIRPLILVLMEKRVNSLYNSSTDDLDVVMKDSGYISPTSASETEDEEVKPTVKRRRLSHRVPITFGAI